MADRTNIEWTDATWNPVTGCSVVSPGCANCYAMKLAGGRLRDHPSRAGLTKPSKAGPVWTGEVRFNEAWLDQPLRWKRPRMIFVCAHGDLFHDDVPDAWIDRVFAVMALAPQHIFQVLTKRPERMREYMSAENVSARVIDAMLAMQTVRLPFAKLLKRWPLPNVWLGTSVEDQARADERIPHLLATPAAVRFVSYEPALGPVDLRLIRVPGSDDGDSHYRGSALHGKPRLDWVIVGGESGPGARPMHPDWARSIRDQCEAAGVPFFFKQVGEWAFDVGPHIPVSPGRLAWVRQEDGKVARAREVERIERREGAQNWKQVARVGKKAAGALLDGKPHGGTPG